MLGWFLASGLYLCLRPDMSIDSAAKGMDMTEDRKPIVKLGFFIAPVATANFSTNEKGRNQVVEEYLEFCNNVLHETCHKLQHCMEHMCSDSGIEVQLLTREQLRDIIRSAVDNDSGQVHTAVITPEGKVINDEHAVEALIQGRSFDN